MPDDKVGIAGGECLVKITSREYLNLLDLKDRIAKAIEWLELIGPPSLSCVGDPVCSNQTEWPPEQWCDSCLANAAGKELKP